jgi:hypothetical protein
MDNYKENDPRMWVFYNKTTRTILIVAFILVVILGILENYFGVKVF